MQPCERGVVIIFALFIVALISVLATLMMARFDRDLARTTLLLHDSQAEQYIQGSVLWAMSQLQADWEQQVPNQPVDKLPMMSPVQTIQGYTIASTITDLQGHDALLRLGVPVSDQDFLVETHVKIATQDHAMFTLLQRTIDHQKPVMTVLWQSMSAV